MNFRMLKVFLVICMVFTVSGLFSQTPAIENIAPGKRVVVSSEYSQQYNKSLATDGDPATVWGTGIHNKDEWLFVDLETVTMVDHVTIDWYDKYYAKRYSIYTSNDTETWELVSTHYDSQGNSAVIDVVKNTRYIGLYMQDKKSGACGITEFGVYRIDFPIEVKVGAEILTGTGTEPTDAVLKIMSKTEFLGKTDLLPGSNTIIINERHKQYEFIIEKSGCYSHIEALSLVDLAMLNDADITFTLEPYKPEEIRVDSMHISERIPFDMPDTVKKYGDYMVLHYKALQEIQLWYVGNVDEPFIVSKISDECDTFKISENYIYFLKEVSVGEVILMIYEITNHVQISLVASINDPSIITNNCEVTLHNNHLFVTKPSTDGYESGIYRFQDNTTLEQVGTVDYSLLTFIGNTGYSFELIENPGKDSATGYIHALDIADLTNIQKVSSVQAGICNGPGRNMQIFMQTSRDELFFGLYTRNGIGEPYNKVMISYDYGVCDVSDPFNPVLQTTIPVYFMASYSPVDRERMRNPMCIDVVDNAIAYLRENISGKNNWLEVIDRTNFANRKDIWVSAENLLIFDHKILAFGENELTIITD